VYGDFKMASLAWPTIVKGTRNPKIFGFKFCALAILLCLWSSLVVGQENVELTDQERAWVAASPVLKVGNETDWPPFDFAINKEAKGYSIDYLRLIAEKTGLRLEFVNGYTWAQLMEMFQNGDLDIMPAIADSPERKKLQNLQTLT
jgi:ABC-type amino acid transport substrate-binding protein